LRKDSTVATGVMYCIAQPTHALKNGG